VPAIRRASPNEVTYAQMRAGIDFDEDELMPGEEADRARPATSDPEEQMVADDRTEA
jgi:hypothetical protein